MNVFDDVIINDLFFDEVFDILFNDSLDGSIDDFLNWNWDGFFNNYFAWHDLKPGGKWEVFPWDEDKTWGDYDGASSRYDWYSMPLTFGMNGDQPPGSRARPGARSPRFGMRPGTMWWRPPGWFSGPLLANAEFRKRFLAGLRGICAHYTRVRTADVFRSTRDFSYS